MGKDDQRYKKRTILLPLIVISVLISALPYAPWLAGGIIPKAQAFAGWLLLIPLGSLVLALCLKKRWATLAFVVLLIIGALPQVHVPPAGPRQAATELRVMSFNAYRAEANSEELTALIKEQHPDLLILVETSEALHSKLAKLGALEELGYRTKPVPAGGVRDTVIFSKNPMTEIDSALSDRDTGWYSMPTVEVEVGHRQILVTGVHVFPPINDAQKWRQGLSAIEAWVSRHPQAPMILAGDFNSTSGHRLYRDAIAGLTEATGLRPEATWPQGLLPFPLVEIDHILGRGMTFSKTGATPIEGSDHLAVQSTAGF